MLNLNKTDIIWLDSIGIEWQQPVLPNLRKFTATLGHVAIKMASFLPPDAPAFMSEHFEHAEKRNDLQPDLGNNYKT